MIYFAVRDQYWRTAHLTFTDEVIEQTPNSFRIRYDWQTVDYGIQMTGHVSIIGNSDGTISVDFYGRALNQFSRNRIGLCVLHPLDGVTGQPCQIESPDGQHSEGRFPVYVSPNQPFLSLQTMRWQPASGCDLRLNFSGDMFETEDQRNWTDASFKTYSTPLSIPFPVVVRPEETVQQRVVFSIVSTASVNSDLINRAMQTPIEQLEKPTSTRPQIGLGQRADKQRISDPEAVQLRKLALSHLRADVFLTTSDWQTGLANAIADARILHISLELALFFGNDPATDLTGLLAYLEPDMEAIRSVLVFDADTLMTSDTLLNRVVPTLRKSWPNVLVGGGTDGFFADVNRNRFDYSLVDFITYCISPQVHAFDDLTLLENIQGQEPTVQTARHLTGGKPVHISPITLLPRYTTVAESATERLSPPIDARHTTGFTANWTRQSLAALAQAGVVSVTYYETHGPRGVVDGDGIFPVFDAFSAVG